MFELRLRVDQLRVDDRIDGQQRVRYVTPQPDGSVMIGLRAREQDFARKAVPWLVLAVQRPVDLTPAQRERAREIWSRGVRYQVAVTDARAAAKAPSVVTVDQDLEIEALAKDAP